MTARDHAISFEAKKHAYRQTQDGVVISFVVQPHDVDATLAAAALGTVYQVAIVQTNDQGQPVGDPVPKAEKRDWSEISAPQQAGIRCADHKFQLWASTQPGGPYADAADFVRQRCGVNSRADLVGPAAKRWAQLDAAFRNAYGLQVQGVSA